MMLSGDMFVVPAAGVKNADTANIVVTPVGFRTSVENQPTAGLEKRARTWPLGTPTRPLRVATRPLRAITWPFAGGTNGGFHEESGVTRRYNPFADNKRTSYISVCFRAHTVVARSPDRACRRDRKVSSSLVSARTIKTGHDLLHPGFREDPCPAT
jgi:hypothetical protein